MKTNRSEISKAIRAAMAFSAIVAMGAVGTAYAQGTTKPQATQTAPHNGAKKGQKKVPTTTVTTKSKKQNKKIQTLQAVTVTGSLLRAPQYQQIVPIQAVPIQARMAAGMNSVAEFVQSSAAAGGSTQINGQFGGTIIQGGRGVEPVNLRGLGAGRTLVLLDGQRPGPAGTGNQVNNFDLNVIPRAVIQRVEIVNDGSSSIYGSDAIAGVVNLITRKNLDHATFDFFSSMPQHGGGQQYSASFGDGWNFANGNITVAAEVDQRQPILVGQRSFLDCQRDLRFGPNGNRVDRADTSILAGTPLAGCSTTLLDQFKAENILPGGPVPKSFFGYPSVGRLTISPDGTTSPFSPIPGFVASECTDYVSPKGVVNEHPGCNLVEDFPQEANAFATVQTRNTSLYVAPRFTLNTPIGPIYWNTQFLMSRRVTRDHLWRQFFPRVQIINGQSFTIPAGNPNRVQEWQPTLLFPSDTTIWDNYKYLRTELSGGFGNSSWTWTFNVHASQSDGTDDFLGISNTKSGDNFNTTGNQVVGPTLLNYFDPSILLATGSGLPQLWATLGQPSLDKTIYKQQGANLLFQGNIPLDWGAGPIAAAAGASARHFSIDDTQGVATWGETHASAPTQGADTVKGIFGQVGVPIIKGVPGIDSLVATLSAREFRYNNIAGSHRVWKYGLNWQVTSTFRIRGTMGTSYRAPALFQEFQAPTSGFRGQGRGDPCVLWGQSNNTFARANCKAAGIPPDYLGGGSSTTVFSVGGGSSLQSETSRAKSLGIVWSPAWANLDFAIDYFDYHIFNEITQIGAGNIETACYARPVFPNEFCTLIQRNPPVPGQSNAPGANNITVINNAWLNINQERDRGYQFNWNYRHSFSFADFRMGGSITYLIQHINQTFSGQSASGFATSDFTGTIGNPRWYGILNAALHRGDWTVNWQGIVVSRTSERKNFKPNGNIQTYFGMPNVRFIYSEPAQMRQTVSATWNNGEIGLTFGVRNIGDKKPGLVSSNIAGLGQVSRSASQYDWYGRTWYARLTLNL